MLETYSSNDSSPHSFLFVYALRIDSIENNVTSISMSTHAASEELTTAAIHQRNARKKSCYLLLIVAVVAGVVVLAILS